MTFLTKLRAKLAGLLLSFRFWVLFLIGLTVLLIAYFGVSDRFTPFTTDAYVQAYVVQVAPQVGGQVVKVAVSEGDAVKKGDLLFEIDPWPFKHRVAYLEAKEVEIAHQVQQLGTDLAVATADYERLKAEDEYARVVHVQEKEIFQNSSTTERKYLDAKQKHIGSEAALLKGRERIKLAKEALDARIGEDKVHALLAEVKAQLAEAKLNLDYTRSIAPCDGVVTDLQLRSGAYVHVGQAALTVIDTRHWIVVANVRENSLWRLKPGQPALVGLQSRPGHLLAAHVASVGSGVSLGQGIPTGKLPEIKRQTAWVPAAQRFQVRLTLDDPGDAGIMRVGMTGSVSIYTAGEEGFFTLFTRGLHRFVSWLYFF